MCRPATCMTCKKKTWKGCGQHIEAVKAMVGKQNWCTCKGADRKPQGFLSALFGSK